ncbi:DMT family transporter [Paucilactobacillus nenjiangensis]|uniref:DMT family transporter n=1 Tax=Paucilactobacillus nenjiangensis TaxID=1296540 RepID=UPI003F98DD72
MISIIATSFASIFVKWSNAPATTISMYRMYFASLLLLPIAYRYRKELLTLRKAEWGRLIFAGILLGCHFGLWFESLKLTTVASSMIIIALQPIVALVAEFLVFGKRTNLASMVTIGVSLIGICLVGWGDFGHGVATMIGDGLSLLCIIALVTYMMVGQQVMLKVTHWLYSFVVFLVAGITLNCFNLITQQQMTGFAPREWGIFWLLAFVPTLAYVIYNYLLNYIDTTTISMSMLGEPVGATILATLLLGESITGLTIVGNIIVLGSVFTFLLIENSSSQKT